MANLKHSDPKFIQLEKDWAQAWLNFAGPHARLSLYAAPMAAELGLRDFTETVQRLNESQREIFENLQQNSNPARVAEWLLARQAETEVLGELSADAYRSLSHTQAPHQLFALAVGVARFSEGPIYGVGVDLESADRAISDLVLKRLVQESEKTWLTAGFLQALDFWILKEAAFKATPDNQGAVISSFCVTDWNSQKNEGLIQSPLLARQDLTCRVIKVEGAGLKAAFAYAFKTKN